MVLVNSMGLENCAHHVHLGQQVKLAGEHAVKQALMAPQGQLDAPLVNQAPST